jgi:hypothetical protein
MGGRIGNIIDKETIELCDTYFLFENPKKERQVCDKEEYKRFKNIRNYIKESFILKSIFFVILTNPLFKLISMCKIKC